MSFSKYLIAAVTAICLTLGSVGTVFAHEGEAHEKEKMAKKLSVQGQRVVDTLEKYAAAVQAGDITEIEKYVVMDDGFSSFEGAFEDRGWASFRKHLTGEFPMFSDVSYTISNIRPYVKRKMAYATMDYAMKVTVNNEKYEGGKKRFDVTGKATMILVNVNKEWKIRHMHTARAKPKKTTTEKKHN